MTTRPFLVLGLCLALGLAVFGLQIGRAVKTGREFDRYLSVKGLSEREAKANLALWPIHFTVAAEELGALKDKMAADGALVLSFLQTNGLATNEILQGLPTVTDRTDERIRFQSPSLARYHGDVTMVVRSTNVDIVKRAIQHADALLTQGVTLLGSGSF